MKTYYYNNKNYIKLYNTDCIELMKRLVNKGMQVDAIITDPPYGYLDHKLDKKFDNHKFFELAYKLIKQNGFLIFFGRGVENARRMVIAEDVGFKFKEEIVWNKKNISSPTLPLGRIHEMAYIFTKGNDTINRVYKPATDEIFEYDKDEYIKILEEDITKLVSKINRISNFEEFNKWRSGEIKRDRIDKFAVTIKDLSYSNDRNYAVFNKYNKGKVLKSIISIFNSVKNSHTQIHPTEKPVKLLQILIELIDNKQDNYTVFDPFAGSCSQAVACYNMNKNFIGCEIDSEYFNAAVNRIYKECLQKLFI